MLASKSKHIGQNQVKTLKISQIGNSTSDVKSDQNKRNVNGNEKPKQWSNKVINKDNWISEAAG